MNEPEKDKDIEDENKAIKKIKEIISMWKKRKKKIDDEEKDDRTDKDSKRRRTEITIPSVDQG